MIQRITKGTLRATEAWTDGRHAEDDKYVELDYELAVALVNVTEGAARATVLKVTKTEPSHGFVASLATLTAWSLKVAECEHQFKVIDEAQKIFVVREMMPKDVNREFLTGPRKIDEIMEKLEIIVNEMMADDGPVPMDLGNASGYDTKTSQRDSDTSNRRVCAIAWKGYKAAK